MNTNKYVKYIAGIIVVAAIFLLGVSFGRGYQVTHTPSSTNTPQNKAQTVSLMIDNGSGKIITVNDIPYISGMTVFDTLKHAMDNKVIDMKYKDYGGDMGIFIESINSVKDPQGKKWWQYWVNNRYSQVGVSTNKVQPGDSIEFKFIQGQQ